MLSNTSKVFTTYGRLTAQRLSEGLKDNNSDASGKLDESISFKVFSNGNKLGYTISMLDYYEFVDEGRKSGKRPPISVLEEWLTYPNVREKIRFNSDAGFSDSERRSLAYVIAKKIGERGTKGTKFFTNVVNSNLIQRDLLNSLEQSISEDVDLLLSEIATKFE